jgi:hypothetical protein
VRSLSGALLAAQKAAYGIPYIRAVVKNRVRDMLHLVFAQTFTSGATDDPHGACADSTYLHRCAVNGSGAFYERNAGTGFTNMAAGATSTQIAIAAINNARVALVYNKGSGIYIRESTDSGSTFAAEALAATAAGTVNALAVAYKTNGGDLCIFYADGANMKRIRRTAGAFGSVTTWTQTAASLNGAAVLFNGDFLLAITGVETTTNRPTFWTLILGDGFSFTPDTWTQFAIQAQAESDESITYQAPSIGLQETVRYTFVEKYSGAPNYTRTYWSALPPQRTDPGNDYALMDPAPLNNSTNYGYAVCAGKTPNTAFYSRPGQVLEAATASVALDMSADLIDATLDERDGITQRAELVFDNTANQYAGPPAVIQLHRTVQLGIGYDGAYSTPPAQSITAWEYRRVADRSLFVLKLRGTDYWLDISRPRTTIVTPTAQTMAKIAQLAAARAGLDESNVGASTRATTLGFAFAIHPNQSALDALRGLQAIVTDVLWTSAPLTLTLSNTAAGDTVDYTYGTDHAIYESRYAAAPAASLAEVAAAGVLGSAYDYTEMRNDKPIQARHRSPHETVQADADDNATARLRKTVLAKHLGTLVTPPNCGIEIADIIAFTDAAISPSQVTARVAGIKTVMKRDPSTGRVAYEQHLALGGV